MITDQFEFLLDVAKLINFAASKGFILTAGELYRPQEMQELYFKQGKSKTLSSNHTKRLAVDFNIFTAKTGLATLDEIRPLGVFWEGLNKKNRWGGNFATIADGPHFERNV